MLPGDLRWQQEVSHCTDDHRCVLDIAGVTPEGNTVAGVEIRNTHATDTLAARGNIEWIEVCADDVLRSLDAADIKNVTFQDQRVTLCTLCHDIKAHLHRMAVEMGYCWTEHPYACEARKIAICAMTGRYTLPRQRWAVSLCDDETAVGKWKQAHSAFLRRGQCLKCARHWKTSYYKPFCLSCYRDIKAAEEESDDEPDVEYPFKEDLRAQLAPLMHGVNGDWTRGCPCDICGATYMSSADDKYEQYRDPGSSTMSLYVWWFGDKLRCCTMCLQQYIDRNQIALRPH